MEEARKTDEYTDDLHSEDRAGQHAGGRQYQTVMASEIKELTALPGLDASQLSRLPVVKEGERLEQGADYLDLKHPQGGVFTAMGDMAAEPGKWYVPKRDTDHELWNLITTKAEEIGLGHSSER